MKIKNILTLITLTSLITTSYARTPDTLKIIRGQADTVYTSPHILVGVVAPGSVVTLNGEQVHVYKTGSFGKEIPLIPGDNTILLSAGENRQETKLNLFYDTVKAHKPLPEITPIPSLTPVDRYLVTTEGAYLNYGNGTDRLGGAKINFLDSGIRLHAIAETETLYKVQLSGNRYSFIPKSFTKAAADAPVKGNILPTLSGSWSVSNVGKYDRVRIALDEKRPYIVHHEINPGKIILDVFGVECNSNWITQYQNLEAVESVDVQGVDSDIMRIIIHLSHNTYWGYSVKYSGNSLVIDIKHAPEEFSLKGLVIGVDAGHGGPSGNGAVSAAGHKEKDQNLAMAFTLKTLLEKKGATVVMSRDEDYEKNNSLRAKEFKEKEIDLLISVHCNAGGNPFRTGGSSTYYHHIEHRELARHILGRVLELEGVQNFGLVGNFNFTLNSPTEFPSVLVETLFMSNLWDEEHIIQPEFQQKMMEKVVQGVEDYLKYCSRQQTRYKY